MRVKPLSIIIAALLAAGLTACGDVQKTAEAPSASAAAVSEAVAVNEKPRLQDDFYTHVNYDFLTQTKLPADKPEVNNMTVLNDKAEDDIRAILKELDGKTDLAKDSDEQKVRDFHRMALDFKTRNGLGLKPVQGYLDQVRAVKDLAAFNALSDKFFLPGYTSLVSMGVLQDPKDSSTNILMIGAPEIGLDKEYLEGTNELSGKVREAYQTFMQDLLVESGYSQEEAAKKAAAVLEFEKQLASAQLSKEEQIDQNKQYNVMTLAEIEKLVPNAPYAQVIRSNGLDKAKKIVVQQPAALKKLNELATAENLETMKTQMELQILRSHSQHLNKKMIEIGAKYVAVYIGIEHVDPDEKLAFQITNGQFGELLGKLYVAKHFSPQAKADVMAMTDAIRDTYARRIEALDWLSPETKARAQAKLKTLGVKIGYPDKWKDFSEVHIKPYAEGGNLVEAVNSVKALEIKRNFAKLNQAPDRTEWLMTPQTVNAYYSPLANEIVFPAAFLQAPFYSPKATRAENLGGIGTVIGHEMSHAFDSTGAQFDEKGNLNNWWTETDLAKFQEKVKQAAAIYSAIEVAPGYHVNGEISTGEIMADLGGLTVALDIAEKEKLDTKEVYESYAQVWRNVITPQALIANLTDEHPPGKYRINNIVNLTDKFYTDYGVKPEDKMYVAPEKRLKVW